jgi:hypothetical protein
MVQEAPLKIYARGVVSYFYFFPRAARARAENLANQQCHFKSSRCRMEQLDTDSCRGTVPMDPPMPNCSMRHREPKGEIDDTGQILQGASCTIAAGDRVPRHSVVQPQQVNLWVQVLHVCVETAACPWTADFWPCAPHAKIYRFVHFYKKKSFFIGKFRDFLTIWWKAPFWLVGNQKKKRWIFRGSSSRTCRPRICSCIHHGLAWSCSMYVCVGTVSHAFGPTDSLVVASARPGSLGPAGELGHPCLSVPTPSIARTRS